MPAWSRQKQEEHNAEHCKRIRALVNDVLSNLSTSSGAGGASLPDQPANAGEEMETEEEFVEEEWHSVDPLAVPAGKTRHFLSIEEVMEGADKQHNAVLEKAWFITEESNRVQVLCEYLRDNVDELIKKVPLRCKEFILLWEQRLAILVMLSPLPKETFCKLSISTDAMYQINSALRARKKPFTSEVCLAAGWLPNFLVADSCTGSGKTIMAIMVLLARLLDKENWEDLNASYDTIVRMRKINPHAGLCRGSTCVDGKLARVGVVFAPAHLIGHWYKTAQSAVLGAREVYGQQLHINVWKGLTGHSLREVYESAPGGGVPTLWIVPMESKSMKVLRDHPDIGVAGAIYDELSMPMSARSDAPESVVAFNYITQATIDALKNATRGMPRHPFRLALGDNFVSIADVCKETGIVNQMYGKVQMGLDHMVMLRMWALPEFVRRTVTEGVLKNMPEGLEIQKIPLRCSTLNGLMTGSDMVKVSLVDVVSNVLGSGFPTEWREDIRGIFGAGDDHAKEMRALRDDLAEYRSGLVVTSQSERNGVRKAEILSDRLSTAVASGNLVCPVTAEHIYPYAAAGGDTKMYVMKCCSALVHKDAVTQIDQAAPRCLACKEWLGAEEADPDREVPNPFRSAAAASSSANGEKERPASPSVAIEDKRSRVEAGESVSSDEEDAEAKLVRLREAEKELDKGFELLGAERPQTTDGVIKALRLQYNHDPSFRALLCFNFEAHQRNVVRKLMQRIRKDVGQGNAVVTDIEDTVKDHVRAEEAKARYDDRHGHPEPQIFLINTRHKSNSVQGLDLFETDLTMVADGCELVVKRQVIGRILRQRKRPREMGEGERFPKKRLLVLAMP